MIHSKIIQKFDNNHLLHQTYNELKPGQLVQLGIKIREGEKFRIQKYKGILISKKNSSSNSSIRIRKIFQKIGVERVFPLNSNQIEFINILNQNRIRHSKLYFLRSRLGKRSLIKD